MLTSVAEAVVGAMPERHRAVARQFIKFGVTGTIGAVIDFSTYNVLTRGLHWTTSYLFLGQPVLVANNISVLLAIISNFLFNKYWTFRDTQEQVMRQWTGYFMLNVVTWTLNQLLVSFFTFRVPLMEALFGGQKDNAAKALAIGIILFINFIGSKFLVFRRQHA